MVNKYMYALFFGLWALNERMPKFVMKYIYSHKPDSFHGDTWIALSTLAGSPDMYSKEVTSLVYNMLKRS